MGHVWLGDTSGSLLEKGSRPGPCLAFLLVLMMVGTIRADDARVQVGTLGGAPIYRWRVFRSEMADDADRALILREFRRKEFLVPPKLVEDGINDQIARQYGGDRQKFAHTLQIKKVTMADYRQFVREEIISAMTMQNAKTPAEGRKANEQWLAKLRAHAKVTKFAAGPKG